MKKYIWMVIVGGIVTLGSFGLFSESVFGGIVLLLLGGGLIALFFIILARKKKAAEKAAQEAQQQKRPIYFSFKVAGVSFDNDDGRSRQDIIKEIRRTKEVMFSLQRYEYNGKPAIAVIANGEQIGNVPAKIVDEVNEAWTKSYKLLDFQVLGEGKSAPFGVLVDVSFDQ